MGHMQFTLIEGQPMLCSEGDGILLGMRGNCAGLQRSAVVLVTSPVSLWGKTVALMFTVLDAGGCSIVTGNDDPTITRDHHPDL